MKKTIALFALVLCILSGLVSGSLALYTKEVDIADTGSIIAKRFVLTAAKSDGYQMNVKIAPGETVKAAFTVSNSNGSYVSEVDMDLEIEVTIGAAEGKTAIPYISAKLLDAGNREIEAADVRISEGEGTIRLFVDRAFVANAESTLTYRIALTWAPHDNDIDYEGPGYGNMFSVKVTGTQSV